MLGGTFGPIQTRQSVKKRKLNILYDEDFHGVSRSPDWSEDSGNPPRPRGSWFPYPLSRTGLQAPPSEIYYQTGPFADFDAGVVNPEIPLEHGWVKPTSSAAAMGITQSPMEALVSGRTYDVGITLSRAYEPEEIDPDNAAYDPTNPDLLPFQGNVQFTLVNDAFGAGSVAQAAPWTSEGAKTSTIVAGASSLYVRVECSNDFHGMLQGTVFMKSQLSALAVEGHSYIVHADDASGAWAGQTNKIATYSSGAWSFTTPYTGMQVYVENEDRTVVWKGSEWGLEQPAIMSNPADVYRRFFAPPDDTTAWAAPNPDVNSDYGQGGPWQVHEQGLFVEGHFGVLRKGGNKNDFPFPPFLYRDIHVSGPSGGYGIWAGNGTPRLIYGGGCLNWELDDTPEYAGVRVDTDGRGNVVNFSAANSVAGASSNVYRIWAAATRLHTTTGLPYVSGRCAEILFSDLDWGGEITFIVVPDVTNDGTAASEGLYSGDRDQVFKISSSYTKAQQRTSLFFKASDSSGWNQVRWKTFSSMAANDLVLYTEGNGSGGLVT
jgi:hypothetical protein